jgi:hypothetical protein
MHSATGEDQLMKVFNKSLSTLLVTVSFAVAGWSQPSNSLGQNAALRYWSAMSVMQDADISELQVQEVDAILDGSAFYDDSKYKDLLQRNQPALELMARGASIPNCDWGLDWGPNYEFGPDLPMEYVKRALVLGRLNVLYAFHLLKAGNRDDAVDTLAAGLEFSSDVGNGGSLFAALVEKGLLLSHLKAISSAVQSRQVSVAQRSRLQVAIGRLGEGLDWQMAVKRDLESLRSIAARTPQGSAALTRIISAYTAAMNDESMLPAVNKAIEASPQDLAHVIPIPNRLLEQKKELNDALQQVRSLLQ